MNAEQKQRAMQMLRRFSQANPRTLHADNAAVDMAALLQELIEAQNPEARLVSYSPDGRTCTLDIDGVEHYYDELIDAPEVEPVAWMVKNGFVCSMIYRSKKDADNYAADQQKRHDLSGSLASFCVIPLYTAPPAPIVPDGWRSFLTDVITAAGLLEHGKRDKGLASRIGKFAFDAMLSAQQQEPPANLEPSREQLTQLINGLDRCFVEGSKREFLRVWIRDWTLHKLPPADLVRDAERYRWLLRQAWFQQAADRFDFVDGGLQNRFEQCMDAFADAAIERDKQKGQS